MAEKQKKKRSEKTDSELAKEHLEKTAHYIDQVANWMGKLTKAVNSKKHPLTKTQIEKATNTIRELYEIYEVSLTAEEAILEKGFEF